MNKDVVKMIECIVWQRLIRNQNDEYRELYNIPRYKYYNSLTIQGCLFNYRQFQENGWIDFNIWNFKTNNIVAKLPKNY